MVNNINYIHETLPERANSSYINNSRYIRSLLLGVTALRSARTTGFISKFYEKQLKGYIYTLDSSNTCRLDIPREDRQSLSLTHPYFVLQIYIIQNKPFTFKVNITDSNNVF